MHWRNGEAFRWGPGIGGKGRSRRAERKRPTSARFSTPTPTKIHPPESIDQYCVLITACIAWRWCFAFDIHSMEQASLPISSSLFVSVFFVVSVRPGWERRREKNEPFFFFFFVLRFASWVGLGWGARLSQSCKVLVHIGFALALSWDDCRTQTRGRSVKPSMALDNVENVRVLRMLTYWETSAARCCPIMKTVRCVLSLWPEPSMTRCIL